MRHLAKLVDNVLHLGLVPSRLAVKVTQTINNGINIGFGTSVDGLHVIVLERWVYLVRLEVIVRNGSIHVYILNRCIVVQQQGYRLHFRNGIGRFMIQQRCQTGTCSHKLTVRSRNPILTGMIGRYQLTGKSEVRMWNNTILCVHIGQRINTLVSM